MWGNHHRMFTLIERSDDRLLLFNGLLLMGVTLVPFPTSLVAEHLRLAGERTAAIVFNCTFVYLALCFNLLWRTAAVGDRLLNPACDRTAVRNIFESYRWGPLLYGLGLALAFVSVGASLALNLGLAIFFALPQRQRKRSAV